ARAWRGSGCPVDNRSSGGILVLRRGAAGRAPIESPSERLRAGEGARIDDGAEGLAPRVRVGPGRAGLGVGHRDVDAEVGHAAGEEPVVATGGAGIQDLDGELHVPRAGEIEVTALVGEG